MNKLHQAAQDLRQLLNYLSSKGYEKTSLLRLVGDRYQLAKDERHLLFRAICSEEEAKRRKAKLILPEELNDRKLAIDGYNVIITIESAIAGKQLVLADDGFVRDISGVFANYRTGPNTQIALDYILEFLREYTPSQSLFYFDAPISKSRELAARVRDLLVNTGLPGDAQAVPAPAKDMLQQGEILATSDSIVVDQASKVIDLAGFVIKNGLGQSPQAI